MSRPFKKRTTNTDSKHGLELPGPREEISLGEQIRKLVLAKIDSGEWPDGYRLPSETELSRAFGTARMTVHGALRALAAAGVLNRRPGAGTYIPPRKPQSTFLEICSIRDEILERSHRYSAKVRLLAEETCDLTTATELDIPPGSAVFHSIVVHHENDRPIQVENRFVRSAFAPHYLEQDFATKTPNEYLMRLGPLDEAEHIVQATMPDRARRGLLKNP